jgi:hypothetical protein
MTEDVFSDFLAAIETKVSPFRSLLGLAAGTVECLRHCQAPAQKLNIEESWSATYDLTSIEDRTAFFTSLLEPFDTLHVPGTNGLTGDGEGIGEGTSHYFDDAMFGVED